MLSSINLLTAALFACSTLVSARPALHSIPAISSSAAASALAPSAATASLASSIASSASSAASAAATSAASTCRVVHVTSTITLPAAPATTNFSTYTAFSVDAPTTEWSSVYDLPFVKILPVFETMHDVGDCFTGPGKCTRTVTSAGYTTIRSVQTKTRFFDNASTVTYVTSVPTAAASLAASPVTTTTVVASTIC